MPGFLTESVQQYLDALASGEPTPGGGSAAALSGALGAALLGMSARFTVGREKYAAFAPAAQAVLDEADALRPTLEALVDEDAVAYGAYRAAAAMPKGTDAEKATRRAAVQDATKASARVPMATCRSSYRLLELAPTLAEHCNPYLVSDVVVATHLALSAFRSALINVRMNLGSLEDQEFVAAMQDELAPMIAGASGLARDALQKAYAAMHLPLEGDIPA
ncbi:MAG TPA: cyclodeaminase/cyclohydrolase family protein [Armatimonadota bacterium]|nr:cyclodeaminase/cyclohydrolase family protein [Armatimonadota bacterium]